jgi:hypothetical protein
MSSRNGGEGENEEMLTHSDEADQEDKTTISYDHDRTLLNRSYSVDTDHYMQHLQMKSKNYDHMRGLRKNESLRNVTKLER